MNENHKAEAVFESMDTLCTVCKADVRMYDANMTVTSWRDMNSRKRYCRRCGFELVRSCMPEKIENPREHRWIIVFHSYVEAGVTLACWNNESNDWDWTTAADLAND